MRLLCFVFFSIWSDWLCAQTPAYMHYDARNGLPGNLVYCGVQDRRGLLWFGTDKGLACFDGIRFRTYGLEDGLPDLEVLKMKEDSQGRLWLFCFRKEPCYFYNGRIYNRQQDSLLARMELSTNIINICEDSGGNLWFFEMSTNIFRLHERAVKTYQLPEWAVGLEKIGTEEYIVGVKNIMYLQPDGKADILFSYKGNVGQLSMAVSGNRVLYSYGDSNMLVLVELKNGRFSVLQEISCPFGQVFADSRGRFWLSSPGRGSVCFDNDRRDLSNPVTFLAGKKITTLFEDAQGTFWFCTSDEGIYALPQYAPLQYDRFPSRNIRVVTGNRAGRIFAGDDIGNLHIIDGARASTLPLNPGGSNFTRQIIPVGDDAGWVVGDRYLAYCHDRFRKVDHYPSIHALKGGLLLHDTLWLPASGVLGRMALPPGKMRPVIERRFTAVGSDANGVVWAGDFNGLYSRRDSFQKNYGDEYPALRSRIMAIQPAGQGGLWVATPESGLLRLAVRDGTVTGVENINTRLEHPIRNIQSLFVEPGGRVWMATNRGVYSLDTAGFVRHLDRYDGLADDDVNAVFVRNDTLWVATVSGLTRMILRQPDEQGNFATLVSSLRYKIDDQSFALHLLDSLPGRHTIVLPAGATSLDLDLAGLDYRSRGNLGFEVERSVCLLPFPGWTFDNLTSWLLGSVMADRKVRERLASTTYSLGTFLPAGSYRIRVAALKTSGLRSAYPDEWLLIKRPRWYETLWFYLALWTIAGYALRRIYQARMAYREISAMASSLQLQALQAQMNPHFIGNSINAIQQFVHPPDPIRISEYVAVFTRLLRRTLAFSEQVFIPFREELDYDREYLQMIHLRFGDRVQAEISGDEDIPPETPIPSMLLQPVLENATIHGLAPEGISVLRLDFSVQHDVFRCTLTDNGIGIRENQRIKEIQGLRRISKGLELLKKKISSLNYLYGLDIQLTIEDLSDTGQHHRGTRVVITYHLKKIWKAIRSQNLPAPSAP